MVVSALARLSRVAPMATPMRFEPKSNAKTVPSSAGREGGEGRGETIKSGILLLNAAKLSNSVLRLPARWMAAARARKP